jgi:hypothetical protein
VHGALRKTSLVPPSRFQISDDADEADAVRFVRAIDMVFEKLAEDADLIQFCQLVSKYPIYPEDAIII